MEDHRSSLCLLLARCTAMGDKYLLLRLFDLSVKLKLELSSSTTSHQPPTDKRFFKTLGTLTTMPSIEIGNYLFTRLKQLGIQTVFGVPGGTPPPLTSSRHQTLANFKVNDRLRTRSLGPDRRVRHRVLWQPERAHRFLRCGWLQPRQRKWVCRSLCYDFRTGRIERLLRTCGRFCRVCACGACCWISWA